MVIESWTAVTMILVLLSVSAPIVSQRHCEQIPYCWVGRRALAVQGWVWVGESHAGAGPVRGLAWASSPTPTQWTPPARPQRLMPVPRATTRRRWPRSTTRCYRSPRAVSWKQWARVPPAPYPHCLPPAVSAPRPDLAPAVTG